MMRFPAQGSFPEKLGQGHGVNQKIKWCSACGPFFMLCNPSTAITPRLQTPQKHFKMIWLDIPQVMKLSYTKWHHT